MEEINVIKCECKKGFQDIVCVSIVLMSIFLKKQKQNTFIYLDFSYYLVLGVSVFRLIFYVYKQMHYLNNKKKTTTVLL